MIRHRCVLIFIIFFSLYCGLASAAQLNSLTLHDYLTVYFQVNESSKNLNLDLKLAQANRDRVDNNLSSNLSISPEQKSQKDEIVNKTWDKEKTLNIEFEQNFPTGTRLTLGGTKWLENSTSDSFFEFNRTIDNSYFIRLEQDLWRNGLGFNQRARAKFANTGYKSAKITNAIEQARLCSQAIDIFLNAYRSQAIVEVNQQIFANSLKLLNSIKRSYRSKLVRKIEFITAQSDHLNNEQKLKAAQIELENQKTILRTSIGQQTTKIFRLTKPGLLPKKNSNYELSSTYAEAFEQNVQSLKWSYQAQKNSQRPNVTMYAQAGHEQNQFVLPNGLKNTDSTAIGLNINIPLNNKQLSADSKESYYQWKKAENEKNLQLRKLNNDLANSLQQNERLKKQLEIVERQKKLQKKQTQEALRLLRSGQIDLRDYIQYRDFELNGELNSINIMQTYFSNRVLMALLRTPNLNACQSGQL